MKWTHQRFSPFWNLSVFEKKMWNMLYWASQSDRQADKPGKHYQRHVVYLVEQELNITESWMTITRLSFRKQKFISFYHYEW